jgi:hypothetical protein
MIENTIPTGSVFPIHCVVSTGLTVRAWILNLDPLSASYLMYWNATTNVWQTGFVNNTVVETSNPGVYVLQLNHADMLGLRYAINVSELTTSLSDNYTVRFSSVESDVAGIKAFAIPMRKEVSRITDNHMQITSYDSLVGGTMVLRQDILHDASGAQPEEIQTNTTNQP